MEFELKHIQLWPMFRMTFFIASIIILLVFLLVGNQFMAISSSMGGIGGMEEFSGGLSFSMIIFASIFNALFFSLLMTAGAALYNYFSKTFGGYKVFLEGDWEVETIEEEIPQSKELSSETDEFDNEQNEE